MRLIQWRFVALFLLTSALIAAGRATATEEVAPAAQPQAAPEATADAQPHQAAQPEGALKPQARTAVAAGNPEEPASMGPQMLLPPVPPPSLQTLVDERRDQLRARREALFDAFRPDYAYPSAWGPPYDRSMYLYRDAARQLYRRQRDDMRQSFEGWMDAMCPWSKPRRDWTRMRSFLIRQEQLDRQELRDVWLASHRHTYAGFPPW
jgi:hypothetical protein